MLGGFLAAPASIKERKCDMKHNVIEIMIRALEEYYTEYGEGRSMEYTYGYMDALAVLRQMSEDALAPVQYFGQPL